jgi:TRAP-type mannitol/chloroaromatic compound transport system permease small subunit
VLRARILARALVQAVSAIAVFFGRVTLPLIIVIGAIQALARNFRWNLGVDLLDLQAVLFFALIMTSFAYGYVHDAHVRIDVLSARAAPRVVALLDLIAAIGIVAPLCVALIVYGVDSTWRAFEQGERLGETGLPLAWLVRAAVPLGFGLLLLAAVAGVPRSMAAVRGDASAGSARSDAE